MRRRNRRMEVAVHRTNLDHRTSPSPFSRQARAPKAPPPATAGSAGANENSGMKTFPFPDPETANIKGHVRAIHPIAEAVHLAARWLLCFLTGPSYQPIFLFLLLFLLASSSCFISSSISGQSKPTFPRVHPIFLLHFTGPMMWWMGCI
jgi:hypothetical protein